MHSRNSLEVRYFARGLLKIFSKSKFVFCFCFLSGTAFKISNYVQKFLSLVVHHLTNFDPLIHRGFSNFPKIKVGNLRNPFNDAIII